MSTTPNEEVLSFLLQYCPNNCPKVTDYNWGGWHLDLDSAWIARNALKDRCLFELVLNTLNNSARDARQRSFRAQYLADKTTGDGRRSHRLVQADLLYTYAVQLWLDRMPNQRIDEFRRPIILTPPPDITPEVVSEYLRKYNCTLPQHVTFL